MWTAGLRGYVPIANPVVTHQFGCESLQDHCSQPDTSGARKLNHQTNEPWFPVPRRQLHGAPPPAAESPFDSHGLPHRR
jgi:hypothetical protein